jgi:methylated-DNA-[protein]-cysteine S-methyltransferase
MSTFYTSFDTAIGPLGIAWTETGICALQLSEESEGKTIAALKRRLPDAIQAEAPAFVQKAIKLLQLHLEGNNQDLSGIPLDLSQCSDFSRKVYEESRKLAAGELVTYSELARRIGSAAATRAVGRALGTNPVAIIVPCHRIIGKNGSMTGFSAYGGCNTKLRLLSIEKALSSDRIPASLS